MPKGDRNGVFRCDRFIYDAYSRPGLLVVGEEWIPKTEKNSKLLKIMITSLSAWNLLKRRWKGKKNMGMGFSGALDSMVTLTVGLACWLKSNECPKLQKFEIRDDDPHFELKRIPTKIEKG
jgi:hypothetical protein